MQATVEQKADGAQTLHLTTSLQAGRLLLHWGVEGGKVRDCCVSLDQHVLAWGVKGSKVRVCCCCCRCCEM